MEYPFGNIEWTYRYESIKQYIPDGCSLLDIGAGDEHMLKHVHPSYYVPVDIAKRTDNTVVVDLNSEPLPVHHPKIINRVFDVVLAQGLLEYLNDIEGFLKQCTMVSHTLVTTYYERPEKMSLWVNNYTFLEVEEMIRNAGWVINTIHSLSLNNQNIYICKKK